MAFQLKKDVVDVNVLEETMREIVGEYSWADEMEDEMDETVMEEVEEEISKIDRGYYEDMRDVFRKVEEVEQVVEAIKVKIREYSNDSDTKIEQIPDIEMISQSIDHEFRDAIEKTNAFIRKIVENHPGKNINDILPLCLNFWKREKAQSQERVAKEAIENRHNLYVKGIKRSMITKFMEGEFVSVFNNEAKKRNYKIMHSDLLENCGRLMPDLIHVECRQGGKYDYTRRVICIEVKGSGDITKDMVDGRKYERIKIFCLAEGFKYSYVLLASRHFDTWHQSLNNVEGLSYNLDSGVQEFGEAIMLGKVITAYVENRETKYDVIKDIRQEEEKIELPEFAFNQDNIIRGYNDSVGKKWIPKFHNLDSAAAIIKSMLKEMPDDYEETTHEVVEASFKKLYDGNDACERLRPDRYKPVIGTNFTKVSGDHKESMISSLKRAPVGNNIEGYDALGREFAIFLNKKVMVNRPNQSGPVEVEVLADKKNIINISFNRACKESKILQLLADIAAKKSQKGPYRTINSEECRGRLAELDDMRIVLEEELVNKINLRKGHETINVVKREIEEPLRLAYRKIHDSLLRTRAARVINSLSHMGNSMLLNAESVNKKFSLYDGGSTDLCYLVLPHGLTNNDRTQVKYVCITRGSTFLCFDNVACSFSIRGEVYTVSNIMTADASRLIMYRNSFSSIINYCTVMALSLNKDIDSRISYAKKCISFATLTTLSPHQNISLITDLYKYMINASLADYSNIDKLITDKASVKIKSLTVMYVLEETRRWLHEMIDVRNKIRKRETIEVDGDIDSDSLGIVGEFPSLVSKGVKLGNLGVIVNELNGINLLRGKGMYGEQEMAKAYTSIAEMDDIFDKDLYEIGQAEMSDRDLRMLNEKRLGQLSRTLIEAGTREYFYHNSFIAKMQMKTFEGKGLSGNIMNISSMNGTISKDGEKSSTSVRDSIEVLLEHKDDRVPMSILRLAKLREDDMTYCKVSKKNQRGSSREITSITMGDKCCYRVIEMAEQSLGDNVDTNIITGNKNKLETIKKAWKKTTKAKSSGQDDMLWVVSEDNKKWSNSMESSVFLFYARNSPIYSKHPMLLRLLENIIYRNMNRKIIIGHKIGKVPEDYEGSNKKAWERVYEHSVSDKKFEAHTGWPQGMFNNLSTNIKTVANYVSETIIKKIYGDKVTMNGVEHSDDSILFMKCSEEIAKDVCKIRYLVWNAFGIKKSDTKSCMGRVQGEMISCHIMNGEVFNPYIKNVVSVSSNFTCKGVAEDSIDLLNRLVGLNRDGASLEETLSIMDLAMHDLYNLYSHGEGMYNDPQKIIFEKEGVVVKRSHIPLTLFGSPGVSLVELCATRAVADDIVKIDNLKRLGLIGQNKKELEILEKLCAFSFLITPINDDVNNVHSRIFGTLRYGIDTKKREKIVKDIMVSMKDIEAGKSFPLFMPNSDSMRTLERVKDMLETNTYKEALAGASDSLSNRRKLALMLRKKCLFLSAHSQITVTSEMTDKQLVTANELKKESFTLEILLHSILRKWEQLTKDQKVHTIITNMVKVKNSFSVYNRLIEYINSFSFTDKILRKGPYVINRPNTLVEKFADNRTIVKILTDIYSPEMRERELGNMTATDMMLKSSVEYRFGFFLSGENRDNVANYVKIYKILLDEATRTTAMIQPHIRGRHFTDYLRNLIGTISYKNLERVVVSSVRFNNLEENLLELGSLRADTQCLVSCLLNNSSRNNFSGSSMRTRLREEVKVEDLLKLGFNASDRMISLIGAYEYLLYGTTLVWNRYYNGRKRVRYQYIQEQKREANGQYFGQLKVKFQCGNTIMEIWSLFEGNHSKNNGITNIILNQFNSGDIRAILREYTSRFGNRRVNSDRVLDPRKIKMSERSKRDKNWSDRIVEYMPGVLSHNPNGIDIGIYSLGFSFGSLTEIAEDVSDVGRWSLDERTLKIKRNNNVVWSIPMFYSGLNYGNCELDVKIFDKVYTMRESNNIAAFIEGRSIMLDDDVVNSVMEDCRERISRMVISDFGLMFRDVMPSDILLDGEDVVAQDLYVESGGNLAGYIRHREICYSVLSSTRVMRYNIDNLIVAIKCHEMQSNTNARKDLYDIVSKICSKNIGLRMMCTIMNGNFVYNYYQKVRTIAGDTFKLRKGTIVGKIPTNINAMSSLEYKTVVICVEGNVEMETSFKEFEDSLTSSMLERDAFKEEAAASTEIELEEGFGSDYDGDYDSDYSVE